MNKIHNLHELMERRRELRKNATSQEIYLWSQLRNRKLGVKFRRQHSIGYYIADFYCVEKKLVIELEGEYHNHVDIKEYDDYRDGILEELGCTILRIQNSEIDSDSELILNKIRRALTLSREERGRVRSSDKFFLPFRHLQSQMKIGFIGGSASTLSSLDHANLN